MNEPDFSSTTLEAAQANALAAVSQQVARLNDSLKAGYLNSFNNWAQSILAGRPNGDPPKPPMAFVVGYFNDPTTGGGAATPGPYANKVVQWAYPAVGRDPVCPMPPVPSIPAPPPPMPERDDIKNVPLGDTLPVGFKMTDPNTGFVYQKQGSPTPFGIAYFYVRVAVLIAGLSLVTFSSRAQTVADSLNTDALALTDNTVALTVTASSGDGSSCTLTKLKGGAIAVSLACQTADGKIAVKSGTLRATGPAVLTMPFGFADVLCFLAINPTAAPVTVGSLGSIPASGVGWSCSTNIRTSGSVTGQTVPVNGSVVWP
jgi:hypothetical protein